MITSGKTNRDNGSSGAIDFGISEMATMDEVFNCLRRRRQIVAVYNDIEDHNELAKNEWKLGEEDEYRWKAGDTKFKKQFVAKLTLDLIREKRPQVEWTHGLWFKYRSPKHSFIVWLAALDHLSTGDRMGRANSGGLIAR